MQDHQTTTAARAAHVADLSRSLSAMQRCAAILLDRYQRPL
jgi:hypothetical protein